MPTVYVEQLKAHVRRTHYDPDRHAGKIYLPPDGGVSGKLAIDFFVAIDPWVSEVAVMNGDVLDVTFRLKDGKWFGGFKDGRSWPTQRRRRMP